MSDQDVSVVPDSTQAIPAEGQVDGTQEQAPDVPAFLEQPESTPDSQEHGQVDGEPNVTDEVASWVDDKRASSYWAGEDGNPDPNKMYDTLRQIEGQRGEFDSIKGEFDKLKTEHGTAQEQLKELQTYKEDVESLLNDPQIGPKIQAVLSEFQNAQLKQEFGDIPPERVEEIQKLRKETQELNAWRQKQEEEQKINQTANIVNEELNSIGALAKEYGLAWSETNKSAFIQHCVDNQVPAGLMQAEFMKQAMPFMIKHAKESGESTARKNIQKGNEGAIPNSANKGEGSQPLNMMDELNQVLNI